MALNFVVIVAMRACQRQKFHFFLTARRYCHHQPSDAHVRVVDMHLSPRQVCVPRLIPLTLALLPKPWNLKLSTDGTYRLLFDSYTVLTMSVNVENEGKLVENEG